MLQVSCSDVRERFHLFALLFVVVVQTMKEYGWREESFWSLAPDCLLVLGAEVVVDWIKHAFITRFNDLPAEVYHDYTISLAYDLAQTKQKYAFSDHSDIVTRRMGFIPLPIGVVMLRVVYTSVKTHNPGAWAVAVVGYLCLLTFRILGSIVILGKACDLIDEHKTRQESGRKESGCSPFKVPKTPASKSKNNETENSNKDDIFELAKDEHEQVFVFQSAPEDKEDVILTKMNSSMLQNSVEELGSVELNNVNDVTPEKQYIEVLDSSLLGPASTQKTVKNQELVEKKKEEDKVVSGLARSHSSPDLVTEASGDDWSSGDQEMRCGENDE